MIKKKFSTGYRSRRRGKRKPGKMLADLEDDSSSSGGELTPTRKPSNQHNQQNTTILSSLRSLLLVISSALICFAAARNTITWHCQRFWGASGDFWQAQWDRFLDTVGEDPFYLWVYGTSILTFCVYWIFGGIYTFLDVTNKPAALRRYKIQPGTNEPVDTKKLLKVIWCVFFNQTVVAFPLAVMFYYTMQYRGVTNVRELPTFHWVLLELAMDILLEEIGFYYSHR
ncbi:hypothetical protein AMK59_3538 [Oryctes borbonicus]|uniref:Fatty acid hydroxylase domain-containing protein n=1 Tax=Oryctes borbonicus TaxID=1629725 RepID=A0A0T6B7D5_9SCAR|nr:hypothetical protein AMK59_3538 [Oryctes borbonicus]